jgi:hypothetical protein
VEGVARDIEHPYGNISGDPGALGAQGGRRVGGALRAGGKLVCGRAVRVGERRADPDHLGMRRHRRHPRRHPADQAVDTTAAAPPDQRAIGTEPVRKRAAIRRQENPLPHSPAG